MLVFYTLNAYNPAGGYRTLTVVFGTLQVAAIFLFFYNMLRTLLAKVEQK
jgi:ABC-type bacteriocin/lantibiotic exporter with double-glycine peptidase domain